MKKILKILFGAAVTAFIFAGGSALTASADSSMVIQTAPASTVITPRRSTVTTTSVSTTVSSSVTSKTFSNTNTDSSEASDSISSEISSTSSTETTTVTKPTSSGEIVKGWNYIDQKWFYFNGEKFITGLQGIDGEPYVFAPNGALRTGWQTVKSARRYYDPDTHSAVYGWLEFLGNKYYISRETGKLTGMQEIDNNTYIFDETGIMQTGCVLCGDFMYCCDSEGKVIYGDNSKTPVKVGDNYYYISPKGYVMRGWQTINGVRTYYDYDTGQPVYGWIEYQGRCYYTDKENGKYTGEQYIGSYPYRFNESGILATGIQYFKQERKYSYFYENGERAVAEFVDADDGRHYFDNNGYMVTGFQTIEDDTYYFDKDGKMLFGFQTIGKDKYYFDKNGIMQTGLTNMGNNILYYFNSKGIMQYDFQIIAGKKYYFDPKTGLAVKGFQTIGKDKYYFDNDCFMVTGKYRIGDDVYYFASNGKMCTGWQTIDGNKYYFGSDGKMYTYRHKINNIDYLFYSTGILAIGGNQNIVLKALSQLGQVGGRPYWTWWGFNFRIEWCACFVSWCASQCGYTAAGKVPEFISCKVGIDWFKQHGQWKGKNYTPKSGDYIFFDWEPDGIADHIGIVDYYEDGYVYTVEGNSSDKVRKKIYDIKSKEIYGFAAPNF